MGNCLGEITNRLLKNIKKVFLIVAAGGGILAWSLTASAQSDPYDPNSPNYVGNKAKVKRPKWSRVLSSSFFSSLDEFAEEGAYYSAVVGYYFSPKWRGDATVGYSHPLDFDAANPSRWGFEDIRLRLLRPQVWVSQDQKSRVTMVGSLDLPASGTSQKASMFYSARVSGIFTRSMGKFVFSAVPTVVHSYHEYDTRDVDGYIKNSPLGFIGSLSLRYAATRKMGVVLGAGHYTYFTYDFKNLNLQFLSASVQYAFTQKAFASLGYRWRDRTLTNNSVFDDDTSTVSLSLGYTL